MELTFYIFAISKTGENISPEYQSFLVIVGKKPGTGNLRETFFFSQTEVRHRVNSSRFGDFTLDDAYTFEIGGPSKTTEQIRGIPNAYITVDGIKGGSEKKIPLWFLVFLY